ncbi:uncharacterized protein LOC116430479 [Nomia melanderi]|uniref:uncharacterized protein LOC116430479 n=1 Tax=Nomia melanderi TaxID=2448451 RepID=UPI003FCE6090
MQRWILVSVASLLIGDAFADVLVQPGYGQPSSLLNPHPIVQPLSTLQRVASNQFTDAGYHLELHPVYGNLGHSTPALGYLQSHDLSPYLSKTAQRRLYSGKLGTVGIPLAHPIVQPHYIPLAVHSRHTRSTIEQPTVGIREKRGQDDVATKSSLNENVPESVRVPLQGGEEKRVEVRQSKNDQTGLVANLLGLNPANMRPVQNQYQVADPAFRTYQQTISEPPKILSQISTRSTTQTQAMPQSQAATSAQNTIPRMNPVDLENAALLRHAYQQSGTSQTTVRDQQRNFPDPRPDATQSSTETQGDRNKSKNSAEFRDASNPELSDDKELVGSKSRQHNIKTVYHIHQHRPHLHYRNFATGDGYPCTCSNAGYVIYNGNDATSGLGVTPLNVQQPAQVYQLPIAQENYSPNSEYVVLPQAYSNYVANYDSSYPGSPTGTYCLQDASAVAY